VLDAGLIRLNILMTSGSGRGFFQDFLKLIRKKSSPGYDVFDTKNSG
jgi:hypothetical protein